MIDVLTSSFLFVACKDLIRTALLEDLRSQVEAAEVDVAVWVRDEEEDVGSLLVDLGIQIMTICLLPVQTTSVK
jgi:hypothetical protein